MTDEHPWRDEDRLREMYHEQQMSQRAIGHELGCSPRTIRSWMDKFGIDPRSTKEAVEVSSYNDEQPWQDKETLEELYCERDMSVVEIANELDGGHNTISRWLDRHDIETAKPHHKRPPHHSIADDGHERWRVQSDGTQYAIPVHRLVAVAEHGVDAVEGMDVHHKNGVPWDNRAENLQLKTREEHMRDHSDNRHGRNEAPWRNKEQLKEAYCTHDTQKETANMLGCSKSTLRKWLIKHNLI